MSSLTVFYYSPLTADGMTDLIQAARGGELDTVIQLVSDGAEVNEIGPQYNLTALHLAALHGHLEVCQFLLDNGANPDAQDSWQCTPLHNAAGGGHADIVKELCESRADLNVRCANKGKTAVDIARDKGKFNVVPLLQDYISQRSREGRQEALDRAVSARAVGGGSKPVIRWKDKEADYDQPANDHGSYRDLIQLPGQVYSRQNSGQFTEEKYKLMKELKRLELQEKVHRLEKEKSQTWAEFENRRGKYDGDLEALAKDIQKLKIEMDHIADDRQSDMSKMEARIQELDENAYRMVQDWKSNDED